MALCVDASVALKWFVPEAGQAEALALRERYADGERLVVPDLFFVEVANGLRHHARTGNLTEEELEQAAELLSALEVDSRSTQHLVTAAVRLAGQLQLTVYDAMYVAVAQEQQAELWTADMTLHSRAREVLPAAHLLSWR